MLLAGDAWLDVTEVRRVGAGPVALTWTGKTAWQATLPVACGRSDITLQAVDARGQGVGTSTVQVIRAGGDCP